MNTQEAVISREQFRQIYLTSVEDVMRFWTPEMQVEISRHNVGWRKECTDFRGYLRYSELRYWVAFDMVSRNRVIDTWCDIGGFFGAYPLTLRRLGVAVAMTEALKYYSDSFSPLFAYLRQEGVEIIDNDPFENVSLDGRHFDVVSAMAVLEHYPHSQKNFMEFMRSIVAPKGCLYIEVPNISFWPRRWALLKGRSPLPPVGDIYQSEVPFTGHHHEYTMQELHQLAALAELHVVEEESFNYSFVGPWIKRLISDPFLTLMSCHPSMRECLAVVLSHGPDDMKRDEEHA
ncbi:class I SAM-dependent methyltransferase [Laribacter hongkongensis]|nr:methyltransferase domain-containing protein [Laribacter hongkongensis]MCG8999054.1 class I SAM-dependent methyltransferase [Laribacter hongkongensis]MCG9007211.1 class I SAM-dependent methyltransferase [Laribacter hongkongensis]MCG9016812.1 class I SAM-dependent methyltransferase [Laribacter hongkongensis]